MKIRPWFRRNRKNIRIALLVIIIALAVFAWILREPPVNDLYRLTQLTEALNMPTSLAQIDSDDRLFISQRIGSILIVKDGELQETPFLDIGDKVEFTHIEQGLFRIVFDPDVQTNGYFYVHYTAKPDGRTVIERYTISEDNPDIADKDSVELIYTTEQFNGNHNGGDMHFGQDGYLYIGLGESGVPDEAQNTGSTLGSIIRIDVSELPYTIPEDNPFVDSETAAPEIWNYGFRNPWRFSFDSETGDMYIGDVGEEAFEEINFIPAPLASGMNFGWANYEASHQRLEEAIPDAEFPIYEYPHYRDGIDARVYQCSVTGGFVYRGEDLPRLQGYYLFADWCSGSIWTLKQTSRGEWEQAPFMETAFKVNAFGQGADGELYVLTVSEGVWKLVAR